MTAVLEVVCDRISDSGDGHPTRVAVDGITAAGKTTFAESLAATLRGRGRSSQRSLVD